MTGVCYKSLLGICTLNLDVNESFSQQGVCCICCCHLATDIDQNRLYVLLSSILDTVKGPYHGRSCLSPVLSLRLRIFNTTGSVVSLIVISLPLYVCLFNVYFNIDFAFLSDRLLILCHVSYKFLIQSTSFCNP